MAATLHQIYIQSVFAVKYRDSLIGNDWKHQLLGLVGNWINETGCKNLIVNGAEDHIHCFFGLKPNISVSNLMKMVKAKSSNFINENLLTDDRFEWQRGYGAFSYSHSQISRVYDYIENQETHHKSISFLDEYQNLLQENLVPMDASCFFDDLL